jgi:hypothetical protein
MPGLVPGIHVLLSLMQQDVDGRDKPGHDDLAVPTSSGLICDCPLLPERGAQLAAGSAAAGVLHGLVEDASPIRRPWMKSQPQSCSIDADPSS